MSSIPPPSRTTLLRAAREAIEGRFLGRKLPEERPVGELSVRRGAFVTLKQAKKLRGCVGYPEPRGDLLRTVRRAAVAAAFEDTRFDPLGQEELDLVVLEISVLSLLSPIPPGEVVPGVHGLVVSLGARRGLLLPQVATEQNWDRERLLAETCVKAGLPRSAWREAGAVLLGFTAEVFSEGG